MALVRTSRVSLTGTDTVSTSLSCVSGSFTPSNNSLLVVFFAFQNNVAATATNSWTVSGGGLTWTQQKYQSSTLAVSGGNWRGVVACYTAPVTTGASMTVTVTHGSALAAASNSFALVAVDVTGYDTTTPVGATALGTALGNAAASITLSGAPATTSLLLAARAFGPSGSEVVVATPGSTFTELYDVQRAGGDCSLELEEKTGTTSTTVDWVDMCVATATVDWSAAVAIEVKAATTAKTITADVGSYLLTGTDATPEVGFKVDATVGGSYALTGTDATLRRNLPMVADPGAYLLTGTDAAGKLGRKVDATTPAAYALTGTDATLRHGFFIAADPGSYALTGADATLRRNLPMVAGPGSYLLTGTDATTKVGFAAAAESSTYTMLGAAVTMTIASNKAIAAGQAAYDLTGADATLTKASNNKTLAADAGSYALTGTDAATTHQWKLDATTAGSYSLAGQVADLLHKYRPDATTAGSYALTGTDATGELGRKVDATTAGSYLLTGTDATLRHGWKLDATTAGSYGLVGADAALIKGGAAKVIVAEAGSYALTGGADIAVTIVSKTVAADVGSYELNESYIVTLTLSSVLVPGSYSLVGTDVTLTKSAFGAFTVTADPGSYALTGTDATLTKTTLGAFSIVAGAGSYALAGTDVTLTAGSNNKVITASLGSYLLTGTPVTLISSAQPALPTRGEWPEKERKKRRRREEERAESVRVARAARDALRASLERLFDGGEYDAPTAVLEEAVVTAEVVRQLPRLPSRDLQAVEDLILRIEELVRQRLLDEMQTDVASRIAKQHLIDSIAIADEVYRRTRQNYLIKTLLLIAE